MDIRTTITNHIAELQARLAVADDNEYIVVNSSGLAVHFPTGPDQKVFVGSSLTATTFEGLTEAMLAAKTVEGHNGVPCLARRLRSVLTANIVEGEEALKHL